MTGLAFMGLLVSVDRRFKAAMRKAERRKDALSISKSMRGSMRVSQTHDVTINETFMLNYFEAVEEAEKLLVQKNKVIDLIEEKLALLTTPNGGEVIRARYIEEKRMEDIAKELHYSRPGVYKLMTRAMAELDQVVADYNV